MNTATPGTNARPPRTVWFAGNLRLGDDVERDCDIVDRWREVVGPRDVAWCLGAPFGDDEEMGRAQLAELTGRLLYPPGGGLCIAPGTPGVFLRLVGPAHIEPSTEQRLSVLDAAGKPTKRAADGARLPRRWIIHPYEGVERQRLGVGIDSWDRLPVALDTIRSITEEHT